MRFLATILSLVISAHGANAECFAALSWPHSNEATLNYSTTGYTGTSCSPIEGERTAVIIVMGQSLANNNVSGSAYVPQSTKNQQLNIYDGKCYLSKSLALGVAGGQASWVHVRLADILISRGLYDRVILVPMAIGGTWASEWANTVNRPWLGRRIGNVACMLQNAGLTPSFINWMQGESETSNGTSQSVYTTSLQGVIGTIRGVGITAPILMNLESWLNGYTYAPVRNAQLSMVGANGVILGANVDSLNNSYRFDGTHLNATGAAAVATMLADIIEANQ